MFGKNSVKFDNHLWEKIRKLAALAGYSSPDEFVVSVVEKELAKLDDADSDERIKERLKGLGYIN
jgi:hypothetical protein